MGMLEMNQECGQMSELPIDSNVKIPKRAAPRLRQGRPEKYPWSRLQIGDSFFIGGRNAAMAALSAAYACNRRRKIKLVTRGVTENGIRGVRIWRVKFDAN